LVADFLDLDRQNILLTNGIDEALQLIFGTYLDEQAELLLAEPTFLMYRLYGEATGAALRTVPYPTNFEFPTDAFLNAIGDRTRVIVLANPNNPTGTAIPGADLLLILGAAPHSMIVVDEAYYEFYGSSLIHELPRFPNLFIARTFSKAYGLAGLRLGAVAGAAESIELLRRLSSPFNINAVALACISDALEDRAHMEDYVEQVREGRGLLGELCDNLGIRYWPSQANFVLVKIGPRSSTFVAAMRKRSIAISDRVNDLGCAGCVRITIAARSQMPHFLQTFKVCFQELGTI
jgi:histidinol-phosphate aminotransferase